MSTAPRPDRLQDRWLKALAHPVRVRVLESMNRGHQTPKDVAADIDEPVASISYHFKILQELECIELVETRQKRGAMQYIYRPLARGHEFSDGEWADLPPVARDGLGAAIVLVSIEAIRNAMEAEKFEERTDRHASFVNLTLDEEGWNELNAKLEEALDLAIELQARATDLPRDEVVESSLSIFHHLR